MKAVVINCSAPHYNLGAHKCADWLRELGYQTHYHDGDPGMWELDADLVALSCIFSWHAPLARTIALRMKERAEVWAGGPGLFALARWWQKETGLNIVRGLDSRFDRQRGHYKMCFASRGCPVACSFCLVPRFVWGEPPADGMITFVDAAKVRSPNPGYCFKQAGFRSAGRTKSGLIVLRLVPEVMPEAVPVRPMAEVFQLPLFPVSSL